MATSYVDYVSCVDYVHYDHHYCKSSDSTGVVIYVHYTDLQRLYATKMQDAVSNMEDHDCCKIIHYKEYVNCVPAQAVASGDHTIYMRNRTTDYKMHQARTSTAIEAVWNYGT